MMTGPKLYFLLLPFFALSKGFCQLPATSTDFEKNTLEAIRTRHVKDLNSLQGAYKKYLADIYKERFDLIKNKFTNKEILVDHTAQAYLDRLTEKILLTNHLPEPKELRILFSKSLFALMHQVWAKEQSYLISVYFTGFKMKARQLLCFVTN
jgi:hypothetical protein